MKLLLLLSVSVALLGCSTSAEKVGNKLLGKECWNHTTNHVEGISNQMKLCATETFAEMVIFYPNEGHNQTTCRQSGTIERKGSEEAFIYLDVGSCQNGRSLQVSALLCQVEKGNDLNCLSNTMHKHYFTNET